jgi:ATP-binding cassette, sub-family E, member 1
MTRIAIIEMDKCNPGKCQDLCFKLCPINRTGADCIARNEEGKPFIDEPLCTGCGICSNRCPFKAISIINLPEQLDKDPIHKYSENGFHLYNLPVPIFGKVVGIVGRNGIGKSTALGILAGHLKPNLGCVGKTAQKEEIIKYFKGTEAQTFFEKQFENKIKISYKPQQVDMIPKMIKGTVRELLEKNDEKGDIEKITQELSLTELMDTDISQISGGELQRLAIAAAVLKKANVYFFDEPTSYLDIKQRIKVSQFIKNLADEETAVMVIEHDLIVLDYMTNLVHLMYGKPSCYGIVSQPKSTKMGINVYLSGFLKEENIRFRDKAIKFESRPPIEDLKREEITSWTPMIKKLGKFDLSAKAGSLKKHEVTGILGENGIGKTSFVKILAGEIDPDQGEISEKTKVSYKPQYINSDSEEFVASFLVDAIARFQNNIITPLELKPLLERQINQLSGGELQRVSIAKALSEDANLFLLDEPSAYLDVEQRLKVSQVIRDIMENKGKTALIVDHDLLLIDYVSDSIMVFDGKPAKTGVATGPFRMEDGMNQFLKELDISLRRDQESKRPRINKKESQMDQKQKKEGKLYYA